MTKLCSDSAAEPVDVEKPWPSAPSLPDEVIHKILALLDGNVRALCVASSLNQDWRKAASAPHYWQTPDFALFEKPCSQKHEWVSPPDRVRKSCIRGLGDSQLMSTVRRARGCLAELQLQNTRRVTTTGLLAALAGYEGKLERLLVRGLFVEDPPLSAVPRGCVKRTSIWAFSSTAPGAGQLTMVAASAGVDWSLLLGCFLAPGHGAGLDLCSGYEVCNATLDTMRGGGKRGKPLHRVQLVCSRFCAPCADGCCAECGVFRCHFCREGPTRHRKARDGRPRRNLCSHLCALCHNVDNSDDDDLVPCEMPHCRNRVNGENFLLCYSCAWTCDLCGVMLCPDCGEEQCGVCDSGRAECPGLLVCRGCMEDNWEYCRRCDKLLCDACQEAPGGCGSDFQGEHQMPWMSSSSDDSSDDSGSAGSAAGGSAAGGAGVNVALASSAAGHGCSRMQANLRALSQSLNEEGSEQEEGSQALVEEEADSSAVDSPVPRAAAAGGPAAEAHSQRGSEDEAPLIPPPQPPPSRPPSWWLRLVPSCCVRRAEPPP